MTEGWKSFPGAPADGTRICAPDDIGSGVESFDIDGFPLLVLRCADGLRGYVNACPHQFLPLDWRSRNILSGDGRLLRCSNHDAGFDACTGDGVDGLAEGCALERVPLRETAGGILIGDST